MTDGQEASTAPASPGHTHEPTLPQPQNVPSAKRANVYKRSARISRTQEHATHLLRYICAGATAGSAAHSSPQAVSACRHPLPTSQGLLAQRQPQCPQHSQPPTHRFSGSEVKGSALISRRLMTEPPGREPDMPARTPVQESEGSECWQAMGGEELTHA